jgi:two-component sensor histidine kinase
LAMYDFICEGRPADGLTLLERSVKEVPPQNLTQSVDMNEEFANCYKSLKQYHKAEQYYIEMMRIFKVTSFNKNFYNNKSDMLMDFIYYNQTLGDFYLLTKQFKKAGFYINKILLLPEGTVRPISLRKILLMKFRIDSASGNYISAINHFEMYKKLNDSLFNITKNQQITEMLVKYETNKKDQSIKLLKSHSLSEYAKLQKANLERNITFIGIAMVLIIAGLAYNGYRNKQRSNLKLEVKRYEINKQNQALQCLISEKDDLLTEKDLLLREIHHRVKNNLQTTMSLLNMQSSYISNEEALEAIRSSQRRMHTMSLIHQKLYQSSNLTCIDMATYINELVTYLKESFEGTGNINFKLQTQTINLDVAQAIPLGLIINEAITNAIKYAFPENRRGTITISLNQVKHDNFRLIISDDGVGLPESFNISRTNSLGIKLMKGLSDQLQGDFYLRVDHGTCATVEFEYHDILKQGFAASNEVLV